MPTKNYLLVLSGISNNLLNYLKRNKVDFREFEFNHGLDLSNVSFLDRNNGLLAWRDCDNFMEGLEWDDRRQIPSTQEEKMNGCYSKGMMSNRGWAKFMCEVKGEESNSYITCNNCDQYSPGSLEGRKQVLETVKMLYEKELGSLEIEINQISNKLEKQNN